MKKLVVLLGLLAGTGCGPTWIETDSRSITGPKGDPGVSYLIDIKEVSVSVTRCLSESALMLTIYQDNNRDGLMGGDEVYSVSYLCNGANGLQGEQGEQGIPGLDAVAEILDPCGDAPGIYDEVILRLSTGQLLASFSDNASGLNTRFSLLTPGTYVTTDGSACNFKVHPDMSVTW